MEVKTISYKKCVCQNCGSYFATIINTDHELKGEKCLNCGEKKLKISGSLSDTELKSQFSAGG